MRTGSGGGGLLGSISSSGPSAPSHNRTRNRTELHCDAKSAPDSSQRCSNSFGRCEGRGRSVHQGQCMRTHPRNELHAFHDTRLHFIIDECLLEDDGLGSLFSHCPGRRQVGLGLPWQSCTRRCRTEVCTQGTKCSKFRPPHVARDIDGA